MICPDFKRVFDKTMGHEGGYVNDPDDPGGETYQGITRRDYSDWPGWEIIDARKRQGEDFAQRLSFSEELQATVRDFYREHFWSPLKCGQMGSETVAAEVFDTAVNMGSGTAVKFLQQALNAFNRDGTIYPDLKVDGGMGAKSLGALAAYLKSDPEHYLLTALNVLQGARYLGIMGRNQRLEKYARGWFGRVTLAK